MYVIETKNHSIKKNIIIIFFGESEKCLEESVWCAGRDRIVPAVLNLRHGMKGMSVVSYGSKWCVHFAAAIKIEKKGKDVKEKKSVNCVHTILNYDLQHNLSGIKYACAASPVNPGICTSSTTTINKRKSKLVS